MKKNLLTLFGLFFFVAGIHAEKVPISEQCILIDEIFYEANLALAFDAAGNAASNENDELLAARFYEFMDSGKYGVKGMEKKDIAFDLSAISALLAKSTQARNAESSKKWVDRARASVIIFNPMLSASKINLDEYLNKIVERCRARFATYQSPSGYMLRARAETHDPVR